MNAPDERPRPPVVKVCMTHAECERARGLVYPLHELELNLGAYLRRLTPPDERGRLIVCEILPALRNCDRLARSLFPKDYSGL